MMELVYPLEDSIVINDVDSSSIDKVLSASPPPPMPTLLLYILTLEGNTSTSGVGWPKSSVLSLVYFVIIEPRSATMKQTDRQYLTRSKFVVPSYLIQNIFHYYNLIYSFG